MRLILENPSYGLNMLEKNKDKYTRNRYEEIKNKIKEIIKIQGNEYLKNEEIRNAYIDFDKESELNGFKILDIDKVNSVIGYFANYINPLYKVKLMKLLWYADFLFYKLYDKSMTGLVYQHLPLGAVPVAYNQILELPSIKVIEEMHNDYIGYNKVYTINDSNINESSNKLNNHIDSSPVEENDIIRIVSYAVDNDNIIFGDIYTYKFILKCLTVPTVDMINNKVVLTSSYRNAEIYYTIDETTPNKSSIKYTNPIELHTDVTLKAVVYVGRFYSDVVEYDTTRIPSYNSNIVTLTGGENIPLKSNILKCFVDVAFTNDYEIIKSLENISYTLNEIVNKTNIDNPMEEFLNRRFSGDSLEIYTDETSTGELDINTDNNTNKFNNYAYPYFEKGKWNLNYFRNKIKDKPTTEEKENRTYSDNHSLIYGKYFGIRFIFNNDKKIKFDTLDININAY